MKWTTLICSSCIECNMIQWYEHSFSRHRPLWLTWRHVSVFNQSVLNYTCSPPRNDPDAPSLGSICQGLQHDVQRHHRFHERCLQIFLPAFWSSRGTTWTCHGYSWDEAYERWGSLTAIAAVVLCLETIVSLSCQCLFTNCWSVSIPLLLQWGQKAFRWSKIHWPKDVSPFHRGLRWTGVLDEVLCTACDKSEVCFMSLLQMFQKWSNSFWVS